MSRQAIMFKFLEPEPWCRRWSRGLFFFLTPIVFIVPLLRGREAVVYVSTDPFSISNYVPSSLPTFVAEVVGYGYYQGTGAALLLAAVSAAFCRRTRRTQTPRGSGLVWYLPAFVAGIEAMRHAHLLGSRHGFTTLPTMDQLRADWLVAAAASISVVVACTALGIVFAKLARNSGRVPLAMVPMLLSVAAGWCAVLSVVWLVA